MSSDVPKTSESLGSLNPVQNNIRKSDKVEVLKNRERERERSTRTNKNKNTRVGLVKTF